MRAALTIILCWAAIYGLVMGALLGFAAMGWSLPLPLQTLIITAGLVPAMILYIASQCKRSAAWMCAVLAKTP